MRRSGTHRCGVVARLLGLVVVAGFTAPPAPAPPDRRLPAPVATPAPSAGQGRVAAEALASLPLVFEPAGPDGFVGRGPGYAVALSRGEAALSVEGGSFRMRPAGPAANPAARLTGRDPLPGTVNRIQGGDPRRWSAGVATYGSVVAGQAWPGVDVVWRGNERRLEHDLVVGQGADPAVVALEIEGARGLTIDADGRGGGGGPGDLLIDLGGTTARMAAPVLYQDGPTGRRSVSGGFALVGPSRVGFRVGAYDASLPLVIDPTLVTSSYLGGAGVDNGYGIALDREGNTYLVGATDSADFPTVTPFQPKLAQASAAGGPNSDVFVAKLNPAGTALLWSTYLGGGGRDIGYGVAVGPDGAVYIAGVTESSDFPRAKAVQDRYGGGPSDAFVAKIAANGGAPEWSTFLGGASADQARAVAVDPSGSAYVTGSTSSVNFPAISAQQGGPNRPDDVDAFVTKIPAAGAPLSYSTRLGGSNTDQGLAIAVDAQGSAYVTGDTLSPGFPTVRPFQAASGGSAGGVAGSFPDAFVTKYTATGSALVYSTFLGGSDLDQGKAIALDGAGAAYVTGSTNSPDFPLVGAAQPRKGGDTDAFVAKIDPRGAALAYSTYYGGSGADAGNAIAVDAAGAAVVAGTTASPNWPTSRPLQPAKAGRSDAFVLKLNPGGNAALFSTFLGGREDDQGTGVALDAQGRLRVVGLSSSPDFPTVKPVQAIGGATGGDAFLASMSIADATATAPATGAPAAPGSSSTGHSRRVRALGVITLLLLAAAVAQTIYLRRGEHSPGPAPAPPAPSRITARATAGFKVLPDDDDITAVFGADAGPVVKVGTGAGAGASQSPTGPSKAGPSKSSRTPKARGGPKGAGPKRPGTGPQAPAPAPASPGAGARPVADDGGEPTIATPAPPAAPPAAPPGPVHEPAIARLLEEDMWRPDPEPPKAAPDRAWERLADDRSGEVEAAGAGGQAASPTPEAAPPPVIPPVPAEELSFWDLFPEDLPPARAGGFSVDEMIAEEMTAGNRPPAAAQPGPPAPPPGPDRPPPEAEIVIAELLDTGPVAGRREWADVVWASQEEHGDDFFIGDLLAEPETGKQAGDPDRDYADADDDDDDDDDDDADAGAEADAGPAPPAPSGRSAEEQARIAADRARRRRSRRGGRRGRPGPPGSSG